MAQMSKPITSSQFRYHTKVDDKFERITAGADISDETIAWLCQLGICGPHGERASYFRAMESGAFACLGWPDAPRKHHRIISDVLCAGFVIDDMCDGDTGIQAHGCSIDTLLEALPSFFETGDPAILPDQSPFHRAMCDLRVKLISAGASQGWLMRFAHDFRGWLRAVAQEVALKASGQVPTVDELLTIRPASGAAYVFANFIETAYELCLTEEELGHADVCQLRQIAARITIYPNDLLSHARESRSGHCMNILTALQHHQQLELPDAVRLLCEMHNEDTTALHLLATRIRARAPSSALRTYVYRMGQFVHGLFHWGLHAGRYSHELITLDEPFEEGDNDISTGIPIPLLRNHDSDSGAVGLT